MLDQNTDRMWYVIGVVLIGAAIIFGMNSLFPNAFASVSENFQALSSNMDGYFKEYVVTSDNLLTDAIIRKHGDGSQITGSNGNYVLTSEDVPGADGGNVGIRIHESVFEFGKTYRLSFDMTKQSGDIYSVFGHFSATSNERWYMDGRPFRAQTKGSYPNDDDTHHFVIEFTYEDHPSVVDHHIYIQPNRIESYGVPYTVAIENLTLTTIEEEDE